MCCLINCTRYMILNYFGVENLLLHVLDQELTIQFHVIQSCLYPKLLLSGKKTVNIAYKTCKRIH